MASNTEVRSRKKRRSFTAEEKARILAEYEAAATPLHRAALLRREGVYNSLLSKWRTQLGLKSQPKRGRPPDSVAAENVRLRKENEHLERRLAKTEHTLAAVGKAHALLQMIAGESNADEERSKPS